jgi:hypothetical protein
VLLITYNKISIKIDNTTTAEEKKKLKRGENEICDNKNETKKTQIFIGVLHETTFYVLEIWEKLFWGENGFK